MKRLLLLIAVLFHISAWSQDWMESYSDQNISIEYTKVDYIKPSDGIEHSRIIFRYINKTNDAVTVAFGRKVSYDLMEMDDSPEREYQVTIPANSALEYGPEHAYDKTFYLFNNDKKGTIKKRLSGFEIVKVELK